MNRRLVGALVFLGMLAFPINVKAQSNNYEGQEKPSLVEMRHLMVSAFIGGYYCNKFSGLNPSWNGTILGISKQEEADPILDNIGQYLGRRIKQHGTCKFSELGTKRDIIIQNILEEWARQHPEGRDYFPFTYKFFGI